MVAPEQKDMVSNLLTHYRASGQEGKDWYYVSRHEARRLAREFNCTLSCAAGVIAAFSPRMTWKGNLTMAERCLAKVEPLGGFATSRERAVRIREGERPLQVLKGPKTREFYRAIMGHEDACVIDLWMCRAAGLGKDSPTAREYEVISAALREAAGQTTHTVAEFQAIVWTQVRRR